MKEVYFISNNTPYNLKGFCEAIAVQILEEGGRTMRNRKKMPQERKDIIKDLHLLVSNPEIKVTMADIVNLHNKIKKVASL